MPRPKTPKKHQKTHPVVVKLSPVEFEELKALGEAQGCSYISVIIRMAVKKYIESNK